MHEIKKILKDLHIISGLNISLFDMNENLITSYPSSDSPFCYLIKSCKKGAKICKKCDHKAFEHVKNTKEIYIYNCDFHLYEAVVPLYNYDIQTGYLMIGQTLTHSPFEKDLIKQTALAYIDDELELDKAIEQITYHTKEQILAYASIINIYGQYLSLTHRLEAKHKDLAQEITQYIHYHYQQEITIESLCDYFYCSRGTLTRKFKEKYQMTIHKYILKYRLKKAKELLKNTNKTIQCITYECGFKDPQHFSKVFKKEYSLSPSEYASNDSIDI